MEMPQVEATRSQPGPQPICLPQRPTRRAVAPWGGGLRRAPHSFRWWRVSSPTRGAQAGTQPLGPTEASGPPASSEPVAAVASRQRRGAGEARMVPTVGRAGRRSEAGTTI